MTPQLALFHYFGIIEGGCTYAESRCSLLILKMYRILY
jgi:hypothetical protein